MSKSNFITGESFHADWSEAAEASNVLMYLDDYQRLDGDNLEWVLLDNDKRIKVFPQNGAVRVETEDSGVYLRSMDLLCKMLPNYKFAFAPVPKGHWAEQEANA